MFIKNFAFFNFYIEVWMFRLTNELMEKVFQEWDKVNFF